MDLIETEEYRGYTISIFHDDICDSPNDMEKDCDGHVFLVHFHMDFEVHWEPENIVNEDDFARFASVECPDCAGKGGNEDESCEKCVGEGVVFDLSLPHPDWFIFPVSAYIHSGVVLSLGSGTHFPDYLWDVSHCGFCCVRKKAIEGGEFGDRTAEEVAIRNIATWNTYLGATGAVVGYTVSPNNDEEGGACCGFYCDGWDFDYPLSEARASVDSVHQLHHKGEVFS